MPDTEGQSEFVEKLQSETCQCGRPKPAMYEFCRACADRLPPRTRQSLLFYHRILRGYMQDYALAAEMLSSKAAGAGASDTGGEAA